jgi:hypothetical protein
VCEIVAGGGMDHTIVSTTGLAQEAHGARL